MAFRAKTRDEAAAYFAGWGAAEYDYGDGLHQKKRQGRGLFLDNIKAWDAGYYEYRVFGRQR